MIKLTKRPISDELKLKIADRIAQYTALSLAGLEIPDALAGAYKDPEVKESLKLETGDKCAYCESKMLHVDYGDVEHIEPKGNDAHLRFEYTNLTLACGVCNTNKGTKTDVLNPYEKDPEAHLHAIGPLVFRRPESDVGLSTQHRLQLNRGQLVERRSERLEGLATLVDRIARTKDLAIRGVLLEQLEESTAADKEFSLVTRTYAAVAQQELAALG